jgi:hypothetical protein
LRCPAGDHADRTYPPRLEVSRGRVRLGTGHDVMRTCLSRVRISAVISRVGPMALSHVSARVPRPPRLLFLPPLPPHDWRDWP